MTPIQTCITVKWKKPTYEWSKITTDGSYVIEKSKACIGGIETIIESFISYLVSCDNYNVAEALAPNIGAKCQGYNQLIFEMGAMLICKMLEEIITSNLKLKKIIDDTVHAMSNANLQISHCYREGNQYADHLAKLTTSQDSGSIFSSFVMIPSSKMTISVG